MLSAATSCRAGAGSRGAWGWTSPPSLGPLQCSYPWGQSHLASPASHRLTAAWGRAGSRAQVLISDLGALAPGQAETPGLSCGPLCPWGSGLLSVTALPGPCSESTHPATRVTGILHVWHRHLLYICDCYTWCDRHLTRVWHTDIVLCQEPSVFAQKLCLHRVLGLTWGGERAESESGSGEYKAGLGLRKPTAMPLVTRVLGSAPA